MNRRFDTVTIVGVGLLGASLGLALKARHLAATVRGVGHRQPTLDTAMQTGAVDATYLNVWEASQGADLIVLCTPATLIPRMLDEVLPACTPKTVVTDVASTKAQICGHAHGAWPRPFRFVGSHPMAGSEKFGPEHADAHLYEGCVTIVEKGEGIDPEAKQTVCDLWRDLGAHVVEMDPDVHDALAARTSHVPHIAAACMAMLAARAGDVRPLIGKGFRDVTRIAASRPEIWRDICLTNRAAVTEALGELIAELDAIRQAVAEGRADRLESFFREGRDSRREVLGE